MAFSVAGNFGGRAISTNWTISSAVTFTSQATVTAGEGFIVAICACDNRTLGDISSSHWARMNDPQGNTWIKVSEWNNGQAATAAGAACAIFVCKPTTTITASSLIVLQTNAGVTPSGSTMSLVVASFHATIGVGSSLSVATIIVKSVDAASIGGMTISSLPNKEYLFVGGTAMEATTSATFSVTNYTNITKQGIGNTNASAMMANGAWRILTGTGDTFSANSAAIDSANIYIALVEVLGVTTVTVTASLDSILQKTLTQTANLDAKLQHLANLLTASLDAKLRQTPTLPASIDAIIKGTVLLLASTDAKLLHQGILIAASLDSVLQHVDLTLAAQMDAILQAGVSSVTLNANLDAIIKGAITLNSSIDSILKHQDLTYTAAIDAVLQHMMTMTVGIDAIMKGNVPVTSTIDAKIKSLDIAKTAQMDAFLAAGAATLIATIDAKIKRLATEATWDVTFSQVGIVYSDADLTASNNGGTAAVIAPIRSTIPRGAGKLYAEITWAQNSSGSTAVIGLTDANLPNSDYVGSSIGSWSLFGNGDIYTNGGSVAGTITVGDGETARMAVDLTNGRLWLGGPAGWAGGGDPETDTLPTFTFVPFGSYFVGASLLAPSAPDDTCTVNFGSTSFVYSVPTGFSPWLGKLVPKAQIDAVLAATIAASCVMDAIMARVMTLTVDIDAVFSRAIEIAAFLDGVLTRGFAPGTPASTSWSGMAVASGGWTPATAVTGPWSIMGIGSNSWSAIPPASTVWH